MSAAAAKTLEVPGPEGEMSRHDMLLKHQGLVRALAWKIYQKLPISVDIEDLIAYGQLGLLEAANHFDRLRGFQFTTFAYHRIRGAILDGLSQLSWFNRADFHGSRYRSGDPEDCDPEDEDLFAAPQNQQRGRLVSLSQAGDQADKRAVLPETQLAHEELCRRIRSLAESMAGDEGKLLRAAYFDGLPLTEAAALLGISKSWASRLHDRALQQLSRRVRDS